jgi:uncharacterized protein (TIGR03790 family)
LPRKLAVAGLLVCGVLAVSASGVGALAASLASPGEEVAVIYNLNFAPESRQVAEHYARRRGIPTNNLIGFKLPRTEQINRETFTTQLQRPLVKELEERGLASFHGELIPAAEGVLGGVARVLTSSKVRYLALAYGVPVRITREATLHEAVSDKLPEALRRNEAAVDSELACLPLLERRLPLTGPCRNPFFGTTNFAALHPTNGVFLVTRLDGPSAQMAMGLVDRALEAETNGFWGRAYFDVRGLTNGGYAKGDAWIRAAAEAVRKQGFEVTLDEKGPTFPAWFPMPQIAVYAGWYDGAVSGPFTRGHVEFMPGAVAYHLHSFSAAAIRNPKTYWVGPLLARGVAATMGFVAEPYLDLTPDVGMFFTFLLSIGCNLAEAAYISQPTLSWQMTVVGDPLYCPMIRPPPLLHAELERQESERLAWSHLRVVNLNLVNGSPASQMMQYLEELPLTRRSAVLAGKLGDLHRAAQQPDRAIAQYRAALELQPSPNHRLQLQFALIELLTQTRQRTEALDVYEIFFRENPGYPDSLRFYKEALPLARAVRLPRLIERYERQIEALTPPPPPAATNPPPGGVKPTGRQK